MSITPQRMHTVSVHYLPPGHNSLWVEQKQIETSVSVPKTSPTDSSPNLSPSRWSIQFGNQGSLCIDYDLVRYHHPDSAYARTHTPSPAERTSHFQSILAAYNALRFPHASHNRVPRGWYGHGPGVDPYMAELNRRRRASQYTDDAKRKRDEYETEKRRREDEEFARSSRSPKERVMVAFGVLALAVGLYPNLFVVPSRMDGVHRDAAKNLTKARSDAQEVGHVRREEMRKRAKELGVTDPVEE